MRNCGMCQFFTNIPQPDTMMIPRPDPWIHAMVVVVVVVVLVNRLYVPFFTKHTTTGHDAAGDRVRTNNFVFVVVVFRMVFCFFVGYDTDGNSCQLDSNKIRKQISPFFFHPNIPRPDTMSLETG